MRGRREGGGGAAGAWPGGGLDYGAVILGTVGLTSSTGLAIRLWRARAGEDLSQRWPYLLGFIIAVYAAQVITGLALRTPSSQADATVTFVYALFAIGIARSWELLGLEGGGPLDLLARRLGVRQLPAEPPPAGLGLRRGVTACGSMLSVHRCFPITPPPRS